MACKSDNGMLIAGVEFDTVIRTSPWLRIVFVVCRITNVDLNLRHA